MEVDGRTFDRGSIFRLVKEFELEFDRGNSIYATMYVSTFRKNVDEVFTIGETHGRYVYWFEAFGNVTLVTNGKIKITVKVFKDTVNNVNTDGFGLTVFNNDGIGFTTDTSMLFFNDYFVSITGHQTNPPKVYDFNVDLVCVNTTFTILWFSQSDAIFFNAFKVTGKRVEFATAHENKVYGKQGTFNGFTINNLQAHSIIAVSKRV